MILVCSFVGVPSGCPLGVGVSCVLLLLRPFRLFVVVLVGLGSVVVVATWVIWVGVVHLVSVLL